jgi:DNA-binding protein H-NS
MLNNGYKNMTTKTAINLSEKSIPELKEIIDRAQAEKEARLQPLLMSAYIELRDSAERLGVSIDDIIQAGTDNGLSKFSKVKLPKKLYAKYRNPKNHALTWSGRGVPPKWFKDALNQGISKDYFLIKRD